MAEGPETEDSWALQKLREVYDCDCSQPQTAHQLVRDVLRLMPLYEGTQEECERLIGSAGAFHIVLDRLTEADLITHGGTIGGSWLEPDGERLLAVLDPIDDFDCYPVDAETAARERTTECWSGDVWKAIVALRCVRHDLAVRVVDVAPTGLGIIRPKRGLAYAFDGDRREEMMTLLGYMNDPTAVYYSTMGGVRHGDAHRWSDLPSDEEEKPIALGRVDNDWNQIVRLLPGPFRSGERRLAFGRGMRDPRAYLTTGPRVLASRAKRKILR